MSFDGGSGVGQSLIGRDELVAYSLVRSTVVVEVAITLSDVGESAITDEPDAVQTFLKKRSMCGLLILWPPNK